jgi:hypothetical protein
VGLRERRIMIKFIYEVPEMHKEFTGIKNIVMETEDVASLSEMLEAYEKFLKAIGYTIDGVIDVVKEDEILS